MDWNPAAEAMFGYTRDEILGEDLLERILPRPMDDRVGDIVRRLVDGLEVLREVRADDRTRMIPVVMMTASREERDAAGAFGHEARLRFLGGFALRRWADARAGGVRDP